MGQPGLTGGPPMKIRSPLAATSVHTHPGGQRAPYLKVLLYKAALIGPSLRGLALRESPLFWGWPLQTLFKTQLHASFKREVLSQKFQKRLWFISDIVSPFLPPRPPNSFCAGRFGPGPEIDSLITNTQAILTLNFSIPAFRSRDLVSQIQNVMLEHLEMVNIAMLHGQRALVASPILLPPHSSFLHIQPS